MNELPLSTIERSPSVCHNSLVRADLSDQFGDFKTSLQVPPHIFISYIHIPSSSSNSPSKYLFKWHRFTWAKTKHKCSVATAVSMTNITAAVQCQKILRSFGQPNSQISNLCISLSELITHCRINHVEHIQYELTDNQLSNLASFNSGK